MNQDFNNFNSQGNNEIPNDINQGINNTLNSQPTSVGLQPNIQQPQEVNQSPINEQAENSFGSNNRNDLNHKVPNKKNRKLIIGIVAIFIIVAVAIAVFVNQNENLDVNNDNSSNNSGNNVLENSDLKQISVSKYDITALTNEGDLYHIGEYFYYWADLESEESQKLEKIASNVEKFYDNKTAVYFIDKQQNLYYIGNSYNGGGSDEPKQDYSGVKEINAYDNFCGLATNGNNELYVKNSNLTDSYCGLNITYEEFTKVADNVREAFANFYYSGYISLNDELYLTTSNTEFKKIMDNVSSVSSFGFGSLFIMTNDNKLYIYGDLEEDKNNLELKLLRDDVDELGKDYFKTINGEYNIILSSLEQDNLAPVKGENKILYDDEYPIYYGTLDSDDIKEFLYYDSGINDDFSPGKDYEWYKLIYISNDDKIVLLDEKSKKEVAYNTNSIKEIFDFVNSKNFEEE